MFRILSDSHTDMYDLATVNISLYVAEILAGFAGAGPSEVNANNDTMVVGQKVQTQLVVRGPGAVAVTEYQWTIDKGNPIKNYVKTVTQGIVTELTPADYAGSGMAYYNTNRDTDQDVSCEFVFRGKTYTESVTLNIEQPLVHHYYARLASFDNGADPVGVRPDHAGANLRLILGGTEPGQNPEPGIEFHAWVLSPPSSGEGEYGLTQLVRSNIEIFYENGAVKIDSTGNQYVLDNVTEFAVTPIDTPLGVVSN